LTLAKQNIKFPIISKLLNFVSPRNRILHW